MHPLRRAVGLLTGVLVLQLTLLGAAAPCTDSIAGHGASASEAAQGGSDAGNQLHTPVPRSGDREDCSEHSANPGEPSGPDAPSCIAMISCVTPLLQFGGEIQLSGSIVESGDGITPYLEPPTRNTVPEPPPPRA